MRGTYLWIAQFLQWKDLWCFPRPKAPGTDFPHPHSSFFCSALVMPLVHSAYSGHKSEIPSPHFSPILSPPQCLLFPPPLVLLETSSSSFTLDQEQYSILFLSTHPRLSHLLMLKALPSHQSGDPFCQKNSPLYTLPAWAGEGDGGTFRADLLCSRHLYSIFCGTRNQNHLTNPLPQGSSKSKPKKKKKQRRIILRRLHGWTALLPTMAHCRCDSAKALSLSLSLLSAGHGHTKP